MEDGHHFCKHDEEIGQIKQICLNDIPEIHRKISMIFDRIEGDNNNPGMATRLSIIEREIANIPTQRNVLKLSMIWGGISGAVIVIGTKVFKFFNGG